MSELICGHELTTFETSTLNIVQDFMRKYAGDSAWSNSMSPRGDGREVGIREIFYERNISGNTRRKAVRRLAEKGILRACEIEFVDGILKGVPLRPTKPTEGNK